MGREACQFFEHLCSSFYGRKVREPLLAQEKTGALVMLKAQPCLALKPHTTPHPSTRALLAGRERTSDGLHYNFFEVN